jgi:hypothetical protein
MNTVISNNKTIKFESLWRKNKNDKKTDSENIVFPWPKESKAWPNSHQFVHKLMSVEDYLNVNNHFHSYSDIKLEDRISSCILCGEKNISSGMYDLTDIYWENGLKHYISIHNIKPSAEFIELIYRFQPKTRTNHYSGKKILHLKESDDHKDHDHNYDLSDFEDITQFHFKENHDKLPNTLTTVEKNLHYIKLDRNQLMILDALMKHGSYSKKYIDKKDKTIFRYSEHAGLLDFNNNGLDRVVISGKTNRVDVGDEEIFLPKNMTDATEYEYIFHTHPATPKPGGRVNVGILYEYPSLSDIFHFLDHYNSGITQGSIVIAPEGLYNIRKYSFDKKKIKIDEDNLLKKLRRVMYSTQEDSIKKFGSKFNTYFFYSRIAQDTTFIGKINSVLNKFQIHIDYYPRIKDSKGRWILDSVYLPLFFK